MEPLAKSTKVKVLNTVFNLMWYAALVLAVSVILDFWYVSLKSFGEKLPYIEGVVQVREPVDAYPVTNKLGNASEIMLQPGATEAKAKVRMARWADLFTAEVMAYELLRLAGLLLGLGFVYQLHKIFNSLKAGVCSTTPSSGASGGSA